MWPQKNIYSVGHNSSNDMQIDLWGSFPIHIFNQLLLLTLHHHCVNTFLFSYHPSVHFFVLLIALGVTVIWSLSHMTSGKRWTTSWNDRQSGAVHIETDKHSLSYDHCHRVGNEHSLPKSGNCTNAPSVTTFRAFHWPLCATGWMKKKCNLSDALYHLLLRLWYPTHARQIHWSKFFQKTLTGKRAPFDIPCSPCIPQPALYIRAVLRTSPFPKSALHLVNFFQCFHPQQLEYSRTNNNLNLFRYCCLKT